MGGKTVFAGNLAPYHIALLNPQKVKSTIFECEFLVVVHCVISSDIFECNIINDSPKNLEVGTALAWHARVPSRSNIKA